MYFIENVITSFFIRDEPSTIYTIFCPGAIDTLHSDSNGGCPVASAIEDRSQSAKKSTMVAEDVPKFFNTK